MYGSEWGRFMAPDPAGLAAANKQSPKTLNRYTYTDGDPVNFRDPTGNNAQSPTDASGDCMTFNKPDGSIYDPFGCGTGGHGGGGGGGTGGGGGGGGGADGGGGIGFTPIIIPPPPPLGYGFVLYQDRDKATFQCVEYVQSGDNFYFSTWSGGVTKDVTTAWVVYSSLPSGQSAYQDPYFGAFRKGIPYPFRDERGHIIANALGGVGSALNLFSQNASINKNEYKDIETTIRQKLTAHQNWTAKIQVTLNYNEPDCEQGAAYTYSNKEKYFRPTGVNYNVEFYSSGAVVDNLNINLSNW